MRLCREHNPRREGALYSLEGTKNETIHCDPLDLLQPPSTHTHFVYPLSKMQYLFFFFKCHQDMRRFNGDSLTMNKKFCKSNTTRRHRRWRHSTLRCTRKRFYQLGPVLTAWRHAAPSSEVAIAESPPRGRGTTPAPRGPTARPTVSLVGSSIVRCQWTGEGQGLCSTHNKI